MIKYKEIKRRRTEHVFIVAVWLHLLLIIWKMNAMHDTNTNTKSNQIAINIMQARSIVYWLWMTTQLRNNTRYLIKCILLSGFTQESC